MTKYISLLLSGASCVARFFGPLLLTLCTSLAAAAPLNYIESINGDIPDGGEPSPIFAFDVGTNTISGRIGHIEQSADFDSFAFAVPTGTQLIAGHMEMTDFLGDITNSEWRLLAGAASEISGTLLGKYVVLSPGFAALAAPLGPGVYHVVHMGLESQVQGTADYKFTFALVVPEPATGAIIAAVIAVALCSRNRRYR